VKEKGGGVTYINNKHGGENNYLNMDKENLDVYKVLNRILK
jgi:hypothetical protein